MSYDTTANRNRRSAREWAKTPDQKTLLEDVERGAFLRKLDAAPFEVTAFEAEFIESFFANTSLNWWTLRRRETCDKMRKAYTGRL